MGKGGDFEREISKTLTEWLTGKKKPYMYWRMPGSGSIATIHEECSNLSGDIRSCHPDAEFLTDYFNIECKTGYPRTNFWQLFKGNKNYDLRGFWAQCWGDSQKADKRPMLIYRKKGHAIILGLDIKTRQEFELCYEELRSVPMVIVRFGHNLPDTAFSDFNEFFKIITPDRMRGFVQ